MKTLKKELLGRNNNILKVLHYGLYFDFCKPFNIYKVEGNFTHNSIKKYINIPDTRNYNIALIITNSKYVENRNYIVSMNSTNFALDALGNIPWKYYDIFWKFYSKSGFEETRKSKEIITYVIVQENKYKCDCKSNNNKIDYNKRYKYASHIGLSNYNGNKHGISQIDIIDPCTNYKITYKTHDGFYSTNINDFIDKSGYLLEEKRSTLKEKAKELRTKRKKEEVNKIDYSQDILNIVSKYIEEKNNISKMFDSCNSYESISNIAIYTRRLSYILFDIENFKKSYNNKYFNSVDNAKYKLERIYDRFDELYN